MNRKTKGIIAAGVVAAVGIGAGVAVATGGDDHEAPITGSANEKAAEAALEHVGEGRVTETEVGDEEGYYEVEVTKDDGSQTDVHLDRDFNVTSVESDDKDSADDGDAEKSS